MDISIGVQLPERVMRHFEQVAAGVFEITAVPTPEDFLCRFYKGIFAIASLLASSLGLGIILKSFFLVTPNLLWSCIGGSLILAGLLLGYIGKKKGRKYSKLATMGYEIAFGVIATAIIIALVIVAAILVFLAFPHII